MDALPTGTVTFLFTDIEGSTQRWERYPGGMRQALRRHDGIVRTSIAAHGGCVFKAIGDGFCAAFETAPAAIKAAADMQRALAAQDWTAVDGLFIRTAIHTGTADERDGDYFGQTLNRVSRLLALAHGGQVLLSATSAALVPEALREDETLLYLGHYRLTDLSRSEAVHQLSFAGGRSMFSPLLALEEPPHNLPVALTSYIESDRILDDVIERIRDSRLLTLCGAGGVGKTRTALEAARRMLPDWRDGEWFVQLESMSDYTTIVRAIASALALRDVARQTTADTLFDYLAPRRLLLVLDNCEHVIEAVATVASTILARCRDVTVLATSREPLHIAGERLFIIEPLSVPSFDPERLPSIAELQASPAVKLFLDRASSVDPKFRLLDAHHASVHQICLRLDGIPLALELAAARIGAFGPRVLAQRLENRFAFLTRGSRGDLGHHRTLHALVDWSWSLLNEHEQRLFRRLAVFAGGWALEAAEAVTAGEGLGEADVFDLLNSLCEKSLVQSEGAEGVRFRFLETIRAFANEKLDVAAEREFAERRHAAYFARVASEAEPYLRTFEQRDRLAHIAVDADNFRAALDSAERYPGLRAVGLALCAGLARVWLLTGAFAEGRLRLDRHLATGDGEIDMQTRALGGAALIALNQREPAVAEYARRVVVAGSRSDDAWIRAYAAVIDTFVHAIGSQISSALASAWNENGCSVADARTLANGLDDSWLLCHVELAAAAQAAANGNALVARASQEEAVLQARRCGDHFLIATSTLSLAYRLERLEPSRSAALLEESVTSLEPRNLLGVAACLECAVRLAVAASAFTSAAFLMGAGAAFRAASAVPAWRIDPEEHQDTIRSALGSERFTERYAAGLAASSPAALLAVKELTALLRA